MLHLGMWSRDNYGSAGFIFGLNDLEDLMQP